MWAGTLWSCNSLLRLRHSSYLLHSTSSHTRLEMLQSKSEFSTAVSNSFSVNEVFALKKKTNDEQAFFCTSDLRVFHLRRLLFCLRIASVTSYFIVGDDPTDESLVVVSHPTKLIPHARSPLRLIECQVLWNKLGSQSGASSDFPRGSPSRLHWFKTIERADGVFGSRGWFYSHFAGLCWWLVVVNSRYLELTLRWPLNACATQKFVFGPKNVRQKLKNHF